MEQYILPLFCMLLNFVEAAACLRFLFSHEGKYWILPLVLSILMLLQSGSIMYASGRFAPSVMTAGNLMYALIAVVWYAIIIIFHYALKKQGHKSNYLARVRKDLAESRYIMQSEAVEQKRKAKRRAIRATGSERTYDYEVWPESWTDLFDKD